MASARTVKLKASVVWDPDNYTSNGHPECSEKWILLVVVPKDVSSYTARTTEHGESFGSPFTMVLSESGPPFTNPITSYGNPYKVRKGDAAGFSAVTADRGRVRIRPANTARSGHAAC